MASVTVARVRSIPIRLHVTFLLFLPLFGYLMALAYFRPAPGVGPDAWGWTWGALLAIGLFASVLVHELAHSLVALREGVTVQSITLLPIGGVSGFEEVPREPGKELRITLVGPLANFALGAPLLLLAPFAAGLLPMAEGFLFRLGALNILVGAFNLLVPAFPMDGGRILRSLLALRMGRVRATHVASMVGQAIAIVFAVVGVLTLAAGGWLLLLIAGFVFLGARAEETMTRVSETLESFRVADVMTRGVDTVAPSTTVDKALAAMLAGKHLVLPVQAGPDAPVMGVLDFARASSLPDDARWTTTAAEAAGREFTIAAPDAPASELGRLLAGPGPVLVMEEGRLVGIVTRADVARFTDIATASREDRGPARGHH